MKGWKMFYFLFQTGDFRFQPLISRVYWDPNAFNETSKNMLFCEIDQPNNGDWHLIVF